MPYDWYIHTVGMFDEGERWTVMERRVVKRSIATREPDCRQLVAISESGPRFTHVNVLAKGDRF
jgi:hypothetical protein